MVFRLGFIDTSKARVIWHHFQLKWWRTNTGVHQGRTTDLSRRSDFFSGSHWGLYLQQKGTSDHKAETDRLPMAPRTQTNTNPFLS